MVTAATHDWLTSNQSHLTASLARIRALLERHAARGGSDVEVDGGGAAQDRIPSPEAPCGSTPYAIDSLSAAFGLSSFERDVLLLCAGPEFQDAFCRSCATAQGDPSRSYPTFGLALAALPEPHWSALSPRGPLRWWQLIEVGRGPSLTAAPLRIDERILHELAGAGSIDERVAALIEPLAPSLAATLAPSQAAEAETVARLWSR